tara:strand:+ start:1445 stop:1720 length:276 start_codon:yes stop_codon:yes gene_type:complete
MSETIEIKTADQFATLISHWHANRMAQLGQMQQVPDEVEICQPGENGEDVPMTAEQREGFKAGLIVAKALFAELPFMGISDEEEAPLSAAG